MTRPVQTRDLSPSARQSHLCLVSMKILVKMNYKDSRHPTTFWILHKNEKIGIMTPHGYTDAIYDSVELGHTEMAFVLYKGNDSVKLSYFEVGQAESLEASL